MRHLLFSSKEYSLDILRPLQAAARARGHEVAWFCRQREPALRADELRLPSTRAAVNWKPDVVYSPGNWTPTFLSGLKVQVFHGFSVDKRSRARGHFRIRGTFDLYCTQGPDTTETFLEIAARHKYFRVRETGWSKMDGLFRDEPPPRPVPAERPCILFGSTFTPELSAAPVLAEEIERLARAGEWHWLVTLHPKVAPDVVRRFRALEGPHLEYVETVDLLPAMKSARVLLTDTSSIGAEFLLQRRPLVTFRNRRPADYMLNVTRIEEVEPAIRRALDPPASLMAAIEVRGDQIHPYRDGRSAERVLGAALECLELGRAGLARRPLAPLRRLQARRRLGYWPWSRGE